jgi:hypothetical protein
MNRITLHGDAWNTTLPGPITSIIFEGDNGFTAIGSPCYVSGPHYPCNGGVVAYDITFPDTLGKLSIHDYHGAQITLAYPFTEVTPDTPGWHTQLTVVREIPRSLAYWSIAGLISGWIWLSILICLPVLLGLLWSRPANNKMGIPIWIRNAGLSILFLIALRLVLMALVDATAFYMRDGRYLMPLALAFPLVTATAGALIIYVFKSISLSIKKNDI